MAFLALFYLLCAVYLWPYTRDRCPVPDPWIRYIARMVIASLFGFAVSAQFVSLSGLEVPFYITLVGAGALKVLGMPAAAPARTGTLVWSPLMRRNFSVQKA